MKLDYRCPACILEDITKAIEQLGVSKDVGLEIVKEVVRFLGTEKAYSSPPSYAITFAHRTIKNKTGLKEPFAELRRQTNLIGKKLAQEIKRALSDFSGGELFRELVLWCVSANHLDSRTAGTGYSFEPNRIRAFLESQLKAGLAVDMIDEFLSLARRSRKILFIHDNVGEIAFDALLTKELAKMGAGVTSALRGGPITSDATLEDGGDAGIFEVAECVMEAGPDTLGVSLEEMTPQFAETLSQSDLIIAKGQANYYVLTEYLERNRAKVVFLFSTKCDAVAEKFGLKGKVNIVYVAEEGMNRTSSSKL